MNILLKSPKSQRDCIQCYCVLIKPLSKARIAHSDCTNRTSALH
uniref:Uncharacterized protein n=1 Tax=Anguilla anguilla TaxID=7936 RepID=A0A0E9UH55_ANGAN